MTPAWESAQYCLVLITCAPLDDDERFTKQRTAVAATGARFQRSTKNWLLEIEQFDHKTIGTLNMLFEVAKEFGTSVSMIKPSTPTPVDGESG